MVEGGGGDSGGDGGEPTLLDAPHLCNQCSPFVFYQHKFKNDFFCFLYGKVLKRIYGCSVTISLRTQTTFSAFSLDCQAEMGSPGFKVFEPFNVTSSLIVGWIAPGFGQISNFKFTLWRFTIWYNVRLLGGWLVGRSAMISLEGGREVTLP